jgi:hypothetical protein
VSPYEAFKLEGELRSAMASAKFLTDKLAQHPELTHLRDAVALLNNSATNVEHAICQFGGKPWEPLKHVDLPCGCHCEGGCGDPYAACMHPCVEHIPL